MFEKKYKEKLIAQLKINGISYSIRATAHAMQRMDEREIDEYVVSGNIMALGKDKITELQSNNDEAIIIDELKNVAIVIGFKGNRVYVITVINKSNVYVKDNTVIERI